MLFPLYDLNPHHRTPWFTVLIILANIGVTIWTTQLPIAQFDSVAAEYGFIPKRLTHLDGPDVVVTVENRDRLGGVNPNLPVRHFPLSTKSDKVYPTLITMMFLHAGWFHLAMNMWMLWVFGNNIEDRLGHLVFVCYYVLGGMLAALTHWATDPESAMPVVGASGAVAAVLGGYAITYPKAKVRTLIFIGIPFLVNLPAMVVLGIWFALQLVSGFQMLGRVIEIPIAFWAHIGGFAAGFLLMPLLTLGAAPAEKDWLKEADEMFSFGDPRIDESTETMTKHE
jgi:hypothetical protein